MNTLARMAEEIKQEVKQEEAPVLTTEQANAEALRQGKCTTR